MARTREIKGHHVLLVALGAFAVILTANMAMVIAATGSFPGLVAKNSYVASQQFNERAERQAKLGWKSAVDYRPARLSVAMTGREGAPEAGLTVTAFVGRPADARSDREIVFAWDGAAYAAEETLEKGLWRVSIEARNETGDVYTATKRIQVR